MRRNLLNKISRDEENESITTILKDAPFVPESMPINDLLGMLQTEKAQLAIVVDDYGATAGLVTIEDIIEELVGDIQDEFDHEIAEFRYQHWFDGDGMLQAFHFRAGAIEHRARMIRTRKYTEEQSAGRALYSTFG